MSLDLKGFRSMSWVKTESKMRRKKPSVFHSVLNPFMYIAFNIKEVVLITVIILNFWTEKSGQKAQTQIRLLLEEQSDQVLHCLLFQLHVFDKIPSGLASLFEF